jgi:hypothetical protein
MIPHCRLLARWLSSLAETTFAQLDFPVDGILGLVVHKDPKLASPKEAELLHVARRGHTKQYYH